MAQKSVEQIIREISAETDRIWFDEPVEIRRLRNGIMLGGAGSYKQNLGNLVFCNGDMRALTMWITPNMMLKALNDPSFTLDQSKKMFAWINMLNVDFLAYCGFVQMGEFVHDITDSYDEITTKEDFLRILEKWYAYGNRMYFWIHHTFPWAIGAGLPCFTAEDIAQMGELAKDKEMVDQYFARHKDKIKQWKTLR